MRIEFTVPGEPKGKGRPRFARAGEHTRTYTPADTLAYENVVQQQYQYQCKDEMFEKGTMLDMRIMAYFAIPKSASKKKRAQMLDEELRPAKKPDMDNIIKIIADALNKIAYYDDSQIVDTTIRKFYSDMPRVEVLIQEIGGMNNE